MQREMQRWISGLDIGIETNPSSNYLIGSFKHYDKHPIFAFYNLGLSSSWEEINGCSQHPVCVNTDDQGIFSTYLENEYALLALVLKRPRMKMDVKSIGRTIYYRRYLVRFRLERY